MKCSRLTQAGVSSLTSQQTQLILGTLLGDGHLCRRGTHHPRYQAMHGGPQELYLKHKAEVLAPLIRTPPKPRVNRGFGTTNWVVNTLTTELLTPFLELCYPGGKKTVTPAWLDQVELLGIAYWFMDDGSLSNGRTLKFHTQGFSRAGTRLLASWLTKQGFDAFASRDREKYWHVELSVDSARKLLTAIRPFIHASMLYKTEIIAALPMINCACCGKTFQAKGKQCRVKNPVCGDPECLHWQRRRWEREYMTPERRARKAARVRARYHLDLEAARAKGRRQAAAWRQKRKQARHSGP